MNAQLNPISRRGSSANCLTTDENSSNRSYFSLPPFKHRSISFAVILLFVALLGPAKSDQRLQGESKSPQCAVITSDMRSLSRANFLCSDVEQSPMESTSDQVDWLKLTRELLLESRPTWSLLNSASKETAVQIAFMHFKVWGRMPSSGGSAPTWDAYFTDDDIMLIAEKFARTGKINPHFVADPIVSQIPDGTRAWRGLIKIGGSTYELARIEYPSRNNCDRGNFPIDGFVFIRVPSGRRAVYNYLNGLNIFVSGNYVFNERANGNSLWIGRTKLEDFLSPYGYANTGSFLCNVSSDNLQRE